MTVGAHCRGSGTGETSAAVNPLEREVRTWLTDSPGAVLLRRDFTDRLNVSSSRITRLIRKLIGDGTLIRIGAGIYAKARRSKLSGRVIPMSSLPELAREALRLLNIPTLPSSADRAYSEGRSQQVPTGRVIGVPKVVRRRIGYGGVYVRFERVRPD
jgi:hypothetical protein